MVRIIGLSGGSSFDGIDVVLVEIENGQDNPPARPTFIVRRLKDLATDLPKRLRLALTDAFGIPGKLVLPPRLAKA